MKEELKNLIKKAGVAEAEAIIAELKAAPPKWTLQEIDTWFLTLTAKLESRRVLSRPGVIFHDGLINGECVPLFMQDLKTDFVWCRQEFLDKPLREHYSDDLITIMRILKIMLEQHLRWRVDSAIIGGW